MVEAPPCDCCGAAAWRYLFSESGIDLGRCSECGLLYVAQMPLRDDRMTEMEAGHFADCQSVSSARLHRHSEDMRRREFERYVDIVDQFAPPGRWLDVGCGTGMLIGIAQERGRAIEGIELTSERLEMARSVTGATVHGEPLESLELPAGSFGAVILINVFSHLTSPAATFSHIRGILRPGGVLLLVTGEIGPGVRKRHVFNWALGDHLYFLGHATIERYCRKLGFDLVHRHRDWHPSTIYTRERFRTRGRSALRNLVKATVTHVPGAFTAMRWYMLRRHADNPIFTATLVLRVPKENGA